MNVTAVLSHKGFSVIFVRPESRVGDAANLITRRRIGALVVCDEAGTLCGMLTERDVVRGLTEHGAALLDLEVGALMTRDVQTITGGTSVHEAMEIMDAGSFRHLPVVRGGAPLRHRFPGRPGAPPHHAGRRGIAPWVCGALGPRARAPLSANQFRKGLRAREGAARGP